MSVRRVLGGLGVVAVAAAVALAVAPDLAAALSVDGFYVIAFTAVAALLALRAIQNRIDADLVAATTGDPEDRRVLPAPGREIDRAFELGLTGPRTPAAPGRATLRDRIEPVAVDAVARREECSPAEAEAMLEDGTWTDDPEAAAFFGAPGARDGRPIDGLFRFALASRRRRKLAQARRALAALSPDGVEWRDAAGPPGASRDDPADGGATADATNRWTGVTALSFAAGAAGAFFGRPSIFLLSVVGVAYAAFAAMATPPAADVRIERTLDEPGPAPGDDVAVTLSVTNEGSTVLPDLRLVDGVPPMLEVTDGSARLATALRPGESDGVTYTVEARRGRHAFEPARVIARNWSGSVETARERAVETELVCLPTLEALPAFPLRRQTVDYVGDVTTDTGGEGVAFYAVREYRRGDPLGRIDWHRLARTGRPATVEFYQERAAQVVIVIDVREAVYLSDADGGSAVEHGIDAASRIAATLLDGGNKVGIAAFGPVWTWLPPGLGRAHREDLRRTLGRGEGFGPLPPTDPSRQTVHALSLLRRRLPGESQVVFVSPLTDDYAAMVARRLDAHGHAVTIVSPDVADRRSPGGLVAGFERTERISRVRRGDVPVIDWDPDRPLEAAVADAGRRWSR